MSDPIADMLTRLRNANNALLTDVEVNHSKLKERRDPELAELREEHSRAKRARAVRVFERAVARGELAEGTDVERAVDLFAAVPFYRRLMTRTPMGPADIAAHVELVLRALGAEQHADV